MEKLCEGDRSNRPDQTCSGRELGQRQYQERRGHSATRDEERPEGSGWREMTSSSGSGEWGAADSQTGRSPVGNRFRGRKCATPVAFVSPEQAPEGRCWGERQGTVSSEFPMKKSRGLHTQGAAGRQANSPGPTSREG